MSQVLEDIGLPTVAPATAAPATAAPATAASATAAPATAASATAAPATATLEPADFATGMVSSREYQEYFEFYDNIIFPFDISQGMNASLGALSPAGALAAPLPATTAPSTATPTTASPEGLSKAVP